MKTVRRFLENIRCDKIEITPQGFFRIPVYAARIGVQAYRKADGSTLREYRPQAEVFAQKTMRSLAGIPITNEHPKAMLSPENAKKFMVGYTSDIIRNINDKYLATDAVITDAETIEDIKKGKVEVSMGYSVELDEKPGDFDGVHYDVVQRNIIHNHLAIVAKGRGGPDVRLRLDGDDAVLIENTKSTNKGDKSMKVKLGDKEFEVADDIGKAIDQMKKNYDKLKGDFELFKEKTKDQKSKKDEEDLDSLRSQLEKKDAENDALKSDLEKAKGEKLTNDQLRNKIAERRSLERNAENHLDDEAVEKLVSMTDVEIMKAVIKTEAPDTNLDDKSEVYLRARFDHIVERTGKSDEQNKKVGDKITGGRKDSKNQEPDSEKARLESMKVDDDAWKQPIGRTAEKFAQHSK